MFLLQIPSPEEMMNVTDSVKLAAYHLAEEAVKNPSAFLENILEEAIHFGLKLLAALAVYIVGLWIIRRIKRSVRLIMDKRKTEQTLASFISSLVSIILTVMLVLVTVGALGINTTSIAAMLGAGAMAIGMALSGTMENFAGGLIILIFKPFKAGDFITTQGYTGTVTDVTMVSTKIVTPDNRTIVIPNGALSNGTIDNYSQKEFRRIEWKVGIEYGSDASACIEQMVKIAESDARILTDKTIGIPEEPYAVLAELADSSVVLMLRAWIRKDDYWPVYFDINKRLYEELPKNGFSFAFPHMDVNLRGNN